MTQTIQSVRLWYLNKIISFCDAENAISNGNLELTGFLSWYKSIISVARNSKVKVTRLYWISAIQNPMDNKKTVISACLGGLSKGRGRCSNYLQEPARMTILPLFTSITPKKKAKKT